MEPSLQVSIIFCEWGGGYRQIPPLFFTNKWAFVFPKTLSLILFSLVLAIPDICQYLKWAILKVMIQLYLFCRKMLLALQNRPLTFD